MTLFVLALLGCTPAPTPITEIGNPEMTVPARVASSLPEWVDDQPTALHVVEQAWLAVSQSTLLGADCEPDAASVAAGVPVDWAHAGAQIVLPEAIEAACGVTLALVPTETLPAGAPDALLGASVLLIGHDAQDRPFELRSTLPHEVSVSRTPNNDGAALADDFELAIDLTVLTAGLDLSTLLADADGVVRVQDDAARLPTNVPDAFRVVLDNAGDGRIDPVDLFLATAASAPPLADQDRDSLPDVNEERIHATDPRDVDSDDDALGDAEEVLRIFTDPNLQDTDEDGVSDGYEVYNGTDPLDPSSF